MHYAVVYSFAPSITGARKTNARLHRSCICTNPELSQFTGQWCPFSTTFGLGLQLFQFLKIYIVRNLFYTVRRTSRRVEVSNFSLSKIGNFKFKTKKNWNQSVQEKIPSSLLSSIVYSRAYEQRESYRGERGRGELDGAAGWEPREWPIFGSLWSGAGLREMEAEKV